MRLSGHTELSFQMHKYLFCLFEEDKKKNASKVLMQELPVLSVAEELFHISTIRICHFRSDVHFLSFSCLPCIQLVVLQPFEVMKAI